MMSTTMSHRRRFQPPPMSQCRIPSLKRIVVVCSTLLLVHSSSARPDQFGYNGRTTTSAATYSSSLPLQKLPFLRVPPPSLSSSSPCFKVVRGGSSPRFPPSVVGPTSSSQRRQRFAADSPQQQQEEGNEEGTIADEDADAVSAKEMIDAFLTRDSRNTFVGT